MVSVRNFSEPPFSLEEIQRYAGGDKSIETRLLIEECISLAREHFKYKVCFTELSLKIDGDKVDFGNFSVSSRNLAKNLRGCESAIIFAATVGIGIDRLIGKYTRLSPSKALILQGIGAERAEALCDAFCQSISSEQSLRIRPRFSPGYGDLSLEAQQDIFSLLSCEKNIGLTLGDSLLMSPSKSVTAFIGIEKNTHAGV